MLILFVILLLEILILQSFSAFIVNFHAYPKMKKYMILNTDEKVKSDTFQDTGKSTEDDVTEDMMSPYTDYRKYTENP